MTTTANPIPLSVARLVPRVAKRLGYVRIGVCQHCSDAVIKRTDLEFWIHRDRGTRSCVRAARSVVQS